MNFAGTVPSLCGWLLRNGYGCVIFTGPDALNETRCVEIADRLAAL